MEFIGGLALYFIAKFLYGLWKSKRDEEPDKYINPSEDVEFKTGTEKPMPHVDMETTKGLALEGGKMMETIKGTRDLFMETLTKIGCQYELAEDDDDNRIFFAYQGEHFLADARDDWQYVQIWDTHWGHIELYDVDEFTRLKKAINGSNLNNSVMTIYTIDKVGKNVDVHSKSIILFIPQIPDLVNYLRLELNEFFRAHQYVGNEMAKLREQEEQIKS